MLNLRFLPASLKEYVSDSKFDLREVQRVLVILALALLGGLATAQLGVFGVPLAGAVLLMMIILLKGNKVWLKVLTFLLLGYAFGSKGFATIGFSPIFIGEAMLSIGILTFLTIPFSRKIKVNIKPFLHWEIGVLFIFIIWQVAQTIPYIKLYQFDTLRDATEYGYAAFAILIMLLIPKKDVQSFFNLFSRLMPFMLLWYPILYFFARTASFPIHFPGAGTPLVDTKGSDVGAHLAGMGALMLLQLGQQRHYRARWVSWLIWLLWGLCVVLIGSIQRGVLVAVAASVGIVVLFQPIRTRWDRPLLVVVVVTCLLLITGLYSAKINVGQYREISAEQLVANVASIFGQGDDTSGGLENTKEWRIRWWNTIIDYTFHGPYFWTGKGYGVNLADSDGFQVNSDGSLRSPHNGHMTILARSGVPGFVLWVIFLAGVALRLLRNILNSKRDPLKARYALWMLAYLVAFGIVASTDVFLEGPMGGIWFWSLIGFVYVFLSSDTSKTPNSTLALNRS